MNVGELLDNWKNDSTWVYDAPNPFVRKDVKISPNPANINEVLLTLSVSENTTIVNGSFVPYENSFTFCTFGQNGTAEERSGDAKRLEREINQFMKDSKEARCAQLEEFRKQGATIQTTNYYEW